VYVCVCVRAHVCACMYVCVHVCMCKSFMCVLRVHIEERPGSIRIIHVDLILLGRNWYK